jgi:hypothetical protein
VSLLRTKWKNHTWPREPRIHVCFVRVTPPARTWFILRFIFIEQRIATSKCIYIRAFEPRSDAPFVLIFFLLLLGRITNAYIWVCHLFSPFLLYFFFHRLASWQAGLLSLKGNVFYWMAVPASGYFSENLHFFGSPMIYHST